MDLMVLAGTYVNAVVTLSDETWILSDFYCGGASVASISRFAFQEMMFNRQAHMCPQKKFVSQLNIER